MSHVSTTPYSSSLQSPSPAGKHDAVVTYHVNENSSPRAQFLHSCLASTLRHANQNFGASGARRSTGARLGWIDRIRSVLRCLKHQGSESLHVPKKERRRCLVAKKQLKTSLDHLLDWCAWVLPSKAYHRDPPEILGALKNMLP